MPRGQCRLETKGILVMQQSAERTQLSPDGEGVMLARELEVAERIRGAVDCSLFVRWLAFTK